MDSLQVKIYRLRVALNWSWDSLVDIILIY